MTGVDELPLKCDCINGSIVNGIQEAILGSFALDKPPGHKVIRESGIKLPENDKYFYFFSYHILSRR